MNQKLIDRGFDPKGRARKTLVMDGYEYFLIEARETAKVYPDFQKTGMALCGCKKLKKK